LPNGPVEPEGWNDAASPDRRVPLRRIALRTSVLIEKFV